MTSLLAKLLGPRAEITIPFPGKRGNPVEEGGMGASVTLWELGTDEVADAEQDAISWLAKKYAMDRADVRALITPSAIDAEVKVQTLYRAMRNPENSAQQYAAAPIEVRQLPPYDIQFLHERFLEHQAANSEYLSLKLDELKRLVLEDLGKAETPEDFWRRCDTVTARYLGRALELRCGELTRRLQAIDSANASTSDSSPSSASSP